MIIEGILYGNYTIEEIESTSCELKDNQKSCQYSYGLYTLFFIVE